MSYYPSQNDPHRRPLPNHPQSQMSPVREHHPRSPAQGPPMGQPPMNYPDRFHNSAHTFNGSNASMNSSFQDVQRQSPANLRKPTIRHIPLTPEGNLVIDVPVPDRVLSNAKFQSGDEFTYSRYTAATSTPDQFPFSGYSLRQQEMQRNTEIFIVVTM